MGRVGRICMTPERLLKIQEAVLSVEGGKETLKEVVKRLKVAPPTFRKVRESMGYAPNEVFRKDVDFSEAAKVYVENGVCVSAALNHCDLSQSMLRRFVHYLTKEGLYREEDTIANKTGHASKYYDDHNETMFQVAKKFGISRQSLSQYRQNYAQDSKNTKRVLQERVQMLEEKLARLEAMRDEG